MKIIKEGRLNTFEQECKRCGCIFQFNENEITKGFKSNTDHYGRLIRKEVAWINCPNCLERFNFTKEEILSFYN